MEVTKSAKKVIKLLNTAKREEWVADYVQNVFSLLSHITGYTEKTTAYIQGNSDLLPLLIAFDHHHYNK